MAPTWDDKGVKERFLGDVFTVDPSDIKEDTFNI